MRNFLSAAIMLHWAVLFGLLAFAWSTDLQGGGLNVLALLSIGGSGPALHASGPLLAGCGAIVFGVIATLFLWAALVFAFGPPAANADRRRVAATALAAAIVAMAALAAGGLALEDTGWPLLPACAVLALFVSLVAVSFITGTPAANPEPSVRTERRNAGPSARIVDLESERAARQRAMSEPGGVGRRPALQTEWL